MPHQHHVHKMIPRGDHHIRNAEPESQDPVVVSVVYVTAAKTFDGPVGGYKTLGASDDTNAVPPVTAQSVQAQHSEQDSNSPTSTGQQAQHTSMSEPTQVPSPTLKSTDAATSSSPSISTRIVIPSSDTGDAKSRSVATSSAHETSSAVSSPTDLSATLVPVPSTSALASTSKSHAITGGAAAGLVIGILVIIGALVTLLVCFRRKKSMKKSYAKADDEKSPIGTQGGVERMPSAHSTRTTASAPRLSLRPVTQFLPDLGGRGRSGNALATTGGQSHNTLNIPNENFSEKAVPSGQGADQTNPFGAHAEVADGNIQPIQANQITDPFGSHAETLHGPGSVEPPPVQAPAPLRVRTPTPDPTNINGIVAAAIAGGARDERYKTPNQLNVSPARSASPALSAAGTEFSTTSASPSYIANSPPFGSVHRIQLDFKPSMDDELGLQAGQLVRLLHEYDDGWALCIRLDRSQQGVAPRTCLSARPVKPRPGGNNRGPPPPRGPPSPSMFGPGIPRPLSPASRQGSPNPYGREPRTMSPGPGPVQRSMSPGPYGGGPQRSMSPGPYGGGPQRSMSPGPYGGGPQRSMSPGPYGGGPQHPNILPPGGKRRSNSASQVRERRMSPPGPSPMNPNAGNFQRVPMSLQAMSAFGDIPQNTPRKPVPGQAM